MTVKFYSSKANANRALMTLSMKTFNDDRLFANKDNILVQNPMESKQWGFDAEEVIVVKKKTSTADASKKGHSVIDQPCATVWDIAESMPGAKRKDVIAECVKKGITFYTARTQYQRWMSASKATIAQEK